MKKIWIVLGFLIILGAIGVFVLSVGAEMRSDALNPFFVGGVSAYASENLSDNRTIGYEFLDDNQVVHIWNTQDDYFFNKSSGIQFTNHFQDYWTKNVFCIGYYSGGIWNKIKCADELSNFNRDIHSDNQTYVNATLWKDISYGSYDLRLGIQYHLGLDDENLSITIYGKNIGIDIPYDLGFAWKVQDVEIPGLGEDLIFINGTNYELNETFDLLFKNMNESYYKISDITKYLRLDWDENLNYAVRMFGDGNQEDFYTTLLINAGHFNPNQEKSTTFYWIDSDKQVAFAVTSILDLVRGLYGPYWIDESTGVIVYVDSGTDISFARTINAGTSWALTEIAAGTTRQVDAWFDQEIPGDSGTLIHVAWLDSSTPHRAYYRTINISDGSLGTQRTVNDTITIELGSPQNNILAITKTVSGNLLYAYSTQTEIDAYKSEDSGASWQTIADPFEIATQEDYFLLFSADTGDDDDAAGIFWDKSANEISIKMYDDSANTWNETLIANSMTDNPTRYNFDASVRHSDNHILLAAHSDDDSTSDDLMTWDLTIDSIASPTVTAKTNIFTNQDDSTHVAVLINQINDDVYIAYIKGPPNGLQHIVFHKSINGMDSWGSEQAYSQTADDDRLIHGGRTVSSNGGRVQWSWFDDDSTDIWVNLVNDIELIVDTSPPYFTDGTPQNQTIDNETALTYDINATDVIEFGCFAVNDTTNFKIDCDGLLENNTVLNVALYNLNITINDTSNNINSTIMSVDVIEAVPDTCTYTSGDWNVDCIDDCVISDPVIGDGSDFYASGSGTFTMTADVSGFGNYYLLDSCDGYCLGGCFI